MRFLVLLAAVTVCVHAGVIQGVVLEQASGRPLARTVVRLDPVSKGGAVLGRSLATRAGRSGTFVFPAVAPGTYLLTSLRQGFFPLGYGQRLPVGHGTPFEVTADSNLFAEMRMRRIGAITGRVLDENGVATTGVTVYAYRARLPLQTAGTGVSDDRGVYRIFGLAPGKYWVRSAPLTLDDGSGWLPSFSPQARESGEARAYPVTVDADSTDADISPEPGTLFHISGIIACDRDGFVDVTLSSETGRRHVASFCKGTYRFDGLAPAAYEIYARTDDGAAAGFVELNLQRDNDAATVQVLTMSPVEFFVRRSDVPVKLFGRRQDLSESEPEKEIKLPRATLAPGHWQFRAEVPPGHYVESINSQWGARRPSKAETATDWFEVFIQARYNLQVQIRVSDQAGQITGTVTAGGKPVVASPVFLWPVAASARRSLGGPVQQLSDTDGHFSFDSLPKGDYRIVASFDVNEIDEDLLQVSNAATVHAEPSQTATIELPLWVAP